MDWTLSTVLPALGLAAAAVFLPALVMRWLPDTHQALILTLLGAAGLLTFASAALFALLYGAGGLPTGTLATAPLAFAIHFVGLGLRAALIWGPILILTGFGLAQGIERRRGERMAAREPD